MNMNNNSQHCHHNESEECGCVYTRKLLATTILTRFSVDYFIRR